MSGDVRPWVAEDGDQRCQKCGRPNPCWFAPSDLWNGLVGGDPNKPTGGVLCPLCFMLLAPHDTVFRVDLEEPSTDQASRAGGAS